MLVIYIVFGIFGLCVGSFANVLIARMPKSQSVVFPASHCPKCQHKLKAWHNIPLFSYVFLGGKCAFCKCKISIIYPLIELSSAALSVLALYLSANGAEQMDTKMLVSAGFLALCFILLLALSLIDFTHLAVPESLLLFSLAFCLASKYESLEQFFSNSNSPFFICLAFMGGIFLVKSLASAWINRNNQGEIIESMGEADVIIVGIIGALCGVMLGIRAILIAGLIQLIFHLIFRGKKDEIPFVPALSVGLVITLAFKDFLDF